MTLAHINKTFRLREVSPEEFMVLMYLSNYFGLKPATSDEVENISMLVPMSKRKFNTVMAGLVDKGHVSYDLAGSIILYPDTPQEKPEPKQKERGTGLSDSDKELFDKAWAAYPHFKARSSKAATLKAFTAMKPDERLLLIPAIQSYKRELSDRDLEYVPAMERWIKGKRFADILANAAKVPLNNRTDLVRSYVSTGYWDTVRWGPMPTKEEIANLTR